MNEDTISYEYPTSGRFKDISNKIFHYLTVVKFAYTKKLQTYWECLCKCGKVVFVTTQSLNSGNTKSCGCFHKEKLRQSIKHGMSEHKLYKVYAGIKDRCYNIKHASYHRYGERGIGMCEEWRMNFKVFYDWILANGYRKGLTIDRINNDGNYEPSNCRLVSRYDNYITSTQCKLNYAKAKEIRKLFKRGIKATELMKQYRISETAIYYVLSLKTWNKPEYLK